jgi:ferritin-like metal-binding protein YciE
MAIENVEDLFKAELQDMYDAEQQLVEALGKMVETTEDSDLRDAFQSHQEETRGHVTRLEEVFDKIGVEPKAKPCAGIRGIIEERNTVAKEKPSAHLLDMASNWGGQKAERYEITAYESLLELADEMGSADVQDMLSKNMEEERAALNKLRSLAGVEKTRPVERTVAR